MVDFSLGQPDFDVPPGVKRAAIKSIKLGQNKYTPNAGIEPLRTAVARKLREQNGFSATSKEIIITNGVTGGLGLAFLTLLDPGDELIVLDPSFVLYRELPKLLGVKVKLVSTYPDFRLPVEKIKKSVSKSTKAIIINSPNAPTGQIYTKQELQALAQLAKLQNLIIISDEIYEDFIYDDARHVSMRTLYPFTVTLNGFSKSFGAPGWRIGYLHAPSKIIKEMTKVQQQLYCCAPSNAQYAALEAIRIQREQAAEVRKYYQRKRDLVYEGLKDSFDVLKPKGSFYIFPKVPKGAASAFCAKALEQGVIVVPGIAFSRKDTHFRLSYGVSDSRILAGIAKLRHLAKNS